MKLPGLTTQILLALALGVLTGGLWPEAGSSFQILATLFIRLVLVIIAPLLFSTLVVGIAGQGDLRRLGTVAAQAIGYFMLLTGFALALGFGLANFLLPGEGIAAGTDTAELAAPPEESFWVRLIPRSIVDAMARGDVLQIVVFSVLFAMALSIAGEKGRPVLDFCRSLADTMYTFTNLVMKAAPLGVFGAAAALIGQHGFRVGESFLRLIVTVYLGLGVLLLVVIPALCAAFRIPIRGLIRALKEPVAIAFATTSSAAALPRAMENMEALGVPRRIVAFVLSTALTFNLAGSTLFAGVAALFIAQAYRVNLSAAEQFTLFGTLFVASKGIANVPRASLVVIAASLTSMGVSPEVAAAGIALLLGIDPILDMPRTAVNTAGNCMAAALVARWQGISGIGQAPPEAVTKPPERRMQP